MWQKFNFERKTTVRNDIEKQRQSTAVGDNGQNETIDKKTTVRNDVEKQRQSTTVGDNGQKETILNILVEDSCQIPINKDHCLNQLQNTTVRNSLQKGQ